MRRILVVLLLGCAIVGAARAEVEIVAESGAQAPGEAAGVEFTTNFTRPVIGGGGHVAFGGRLSGPGITNANNDVIFAGIPRSLRKVVQEGQPAPGTAAGVTFSSVPLNTAGTYNRHVVSDSGDVAFFARLLGPGVVTANQDGIWAEIDDALTLIARDGQLLPGGATLQSLTDFTFTDAGVVLFLTANPGGDEIWFYRAGELDLVAAEGEPAPGFIDCDIGALHRPVGSPSGKIAFRADLTPSTCPTTLYVADGGTVSPVLSTGDLVPGLPAGSEIRDFEAGANLLLPKINEHGDLIVNAQVVVPGEPGTFVSSWLVRAEGELELLAFEEELLASDPAISIDALSDPGVGNLTGRSALRAGLSGSTATAILVGDSRPSFDYDPLTDIGTIGLTEAARVGQQAAGFAMGTNYQSLDVPFINNSGHVAFNGTLSIGGTCLWLGPPGGLSVAACTGQSVDVVDPLSGPRVETPSSILSLTGSAVPDGSGSGDGLSGRFSDTGQVVARTSFSSSATTAVVISPPMPIDTDSDGIPDHLEGGNDIDGDGLANFEDLDSDADGTDDDFDNCPLVANAAQDPAPFGQTVVAANIARFEWPVASGVVAARGTFTASSDIAAFLVDHTTTLFGRNLPAPETPAGGTGLWYLLRPDCTAGSWVSGSDAELPGRDTALP